MEIVATNRQTRIVAGTGCCDEQRIVLGMSSELVIEDSKVDTGIHVNAGAFGSTAAQKVI